MGILPFILLAASLAVFLLSTRQFSLLWRLSIWIVGLALLAASAIVVLAGPTSPGVLQALVDLVFRQHGGEVLTTAFDGNFATVGAAIAPMFGIFLVLAAIVSVVSLIAFTPGEFIERIIRPINTALLGAIGGGLLALAVAGIGIGGLEKRQVFLNVIARGDVVDGDTVRMGDVSLRLWGVDAPEQHPDQMCRRKDSPWMLYNCGDEAGSVLSTLTVHKLVICETPNRAAASARQGAEQKPPEEPFGRPIMSCWTGEAGDRLYLSAEMARQGYAVAYPDNREDPSKEQVSTAVADAKSRHLGMWNGWTISPDDWRNNKPCREWFSSDSWQPPPSDDPMVQCPPFAVASPANDNAPAGPVTTPPTKP